jgi:magnesium transporter
VEVLTALDDAGISRLRDAHEFFWLDLLSPTAADLERMSELLGLHPAAVEDSQEWQQLPRLDDYDDHALLIFFTARTVDDQVEPIEVHLYISGSWVITVRRCETALDAQREWIAGHECDEDQVLYHLLDALTDGWDPVIDRLDRRVDVLEDAVLSRAQQIHLRTIYRLKQEVRELLRRAHPQSVAFMPAMETINNLPGLTRGSREWLRDVDAHLDSVASDLQRLNGDLSALTDTFFNASANRLNRLATVIAVGSVFFLVWTLVTGFFGQNFQYLTDHVDTKGAFYGYEIGALVIPTIVLAGLLWWRRKDWW